jgi:hypothetical protein
MYGSKRGGWRTRPSRYCALPLPTQWTKRGAHLLLQMRVKTLNNELASIFCRWYPDFQVEDTALAA